MKFLFLSNKAAVNLISCLSKKYFPLMDLIIGRIKLPAYKAALTKNNLSAVTFSLSQQFES